MRGLPIPSGSDVAAQAPRSIACSSCSSRLQRLVLRRLRREVFQLKHRANLDFRIYRHGIRAALHPLDGFIDRSYLPEPEARDEFLGLGKRSIDHGSIAARELHALSLDARAQPLAREHDARLHQILVELAHFSQESLSRHDSL